MKTTDLREIIDICQAKGISRLRMGGLEIDFREIPAISDPQQPAPTVPTRLDVQNHELMAEMELTQRMLDDPLGYEQTEIDRHLGVQQREQTTQDQ